MGYMDSKIACLGKGESIGFDHLLLTLFNSIHSPRPWSEFLLALCEQLQGYTATLVLRQPAFGDRGEMFDVNTVKSVVEVYRTTSFQDDPFLELEEGTVSNIFDRVSYEQLLGSRYYNELLKLDDIVDILAINIAFGDAYIGSLKIARRIGSRYFGLMEKSLVMRLYPHLKVALEIYERSQRQHIENCAYIKAIDQLAFGVIILNERGHVVRVNETASELMQTGQLLTLAGNLLRARNADEEIRLANAVQGILTSKMPVYATTLSLKLKAKSSDGALYILLKPIHNDQAGERAMGVAIFLSDGTLQRTVAIDTCAAMYGISRAEVALLTELVDGTSILEASTALGISEHTARAQLRSIFAKTDTHRQADLFRLVLTSLAIIA
jgi:DNA-binding CsgD family transcriptional regulator/PAS domain-containing protein